MTARTLSGTEKQWRSQSYGDGVKLAMEGPPGRVGPLPKDEQQAFLTAVLSKGVSRT